MFCKDNNITVQQTQILGISFEIRKFKKENFKKRKEEKNKINLYYKNRYKKLDYVKSQHFSYQSCGCSRQNSKRYSFEDWFSKQKNNWFIEH